MNTGPNGISLYPTTPAIHYKDKPCANPGLSADYTKQGKPGILEDQPK